MPARKTGFAAVVALMAQLAMPPIGSAQRFSEEETNAQLQKLGSDDPQDRLDAAEILGRRGWRLRRQVAPRLQRCSGTTQTGESAPLRAGPSAG